MHVPFPPLSPFIPHTMLPYLVIVCARLGAFPRHRPEGREGKRKEREKRWLVGGEESSSTYIGVAQHVGSVDSGLTVIRRREREREIYRYKYRDEMRYIRDVMVKVPAIYAG